MVISGREVMGCCIVAGSGCRGVCMLLAAWSGGGGIVE